MINQRSSSRVWPLNAVCFISLFLTSCGESNAIGDLQAKYPVEVESCVCRYLAYQADSYSRVEYDEMVNHCNVTTRNGHPSLPRDIVSEPLIDSLRCTEDVEDWQEVVTEELSQQASNRRNYQEITKPEGGTNR